MSDDHPASAAALMAQGISLSAEEGHVFGPLDITLGDTGLTVVSGPGGSGRTSLALVLSGRMKPSEGTVTVLGSTDITTIRRSVAVAGVDKLDGIHRSVTVRNALTEHQAWTSKWYKFNRKADRARQEDICAGIYGGRELPDLDSYISDLSGLDELLLRLCLALRPPHGGTVGMLVVDDLEQVREQSDRAVLLSTLSTLAETMPVVVFAANPLPDGAPRHRAMSTCPGEPGEPDGPDGPDDPGDRQATAPTEAYIPKHAAPAATDRTPEN